MVRAAYKTKGWVLKDLSTIEQCLLGGETVESFRNMLEQKEGCRVTGTLSVSKLAGSLHFSPSQDFTLAHSMGDNKAAFSQGVFDSSHNITRFSFGAEYPGMVNPLAGVAKGTTVGGFSANTLYNYYAKVVPTEYLFISGKMVDTNQYSVTHNEQAGSDTVLPGIYFFYDFSSIQVVYQEFQEGLSHFLTQICAIVGGIFTVSGLLDRIVYNVISKKSQSLGIGE